MEEHKFSRSARFGRLGIETGLCSQFVREHLQSSDVKELFEMIAFEQPVIVTGSPSSPRLQNWSSHPEWWKWQATKFLHVAVDVCDQLIRAGRYFLHEHPLGDPRSAETTAFGQT